MEEEEEEVDSNDKGEEGAGNVKQSRSLDEFADQILSDGTDRFGWAQFERVFRERSRLREAKDEVEAYDPNQRLKNSNIGQRTLNRLGQQRSLAEISFLAVQLLDPVQISDAILRYTNQRPSPQARWIIVYHGPNGSKCSLLVLDPGLSRLNPGVRNRLIDPIYYQSFLNNPRPEAIDKINRLAPELLPELGSSLELALELAWIARPAVMIAPAPEMTPTCVPVPSWRIECKDVKSSVGAIVRDDTGRLGVTACYHGTGNIGTEATIRDGNEVIQSTVILANSIVDTCFLPVSDNWRPGRMRALSGLLDSRAPGNSEPHTFLRFGLSEPTPTRIIGVDWGVPFHRAGRQLCVQTKADTNHGDSGTALVNGDDRLVGFAFQRTSYGDPAPVEFADWIWARSALSELKLSLAC